MNTKYLLEKLMAQEDMAYSEARLLMKSFLSGVLSSSLVASFLTALQIKGESVDELLGFIEEMREHMIEINIQGKAIDVCGTGGDGKGTFNISTGTAFVTAGAGVKVVKHGNRAASSHCGSADVLEALGVDTMLSVNESVECLRAVGMTFLFAPQYHPAMKHVASVRRELGIRTVFNFLGPFVNPARVRRQIVGVSDLGMAEKLSKVARRLDYEHLLILSGADGLDEASVSSPTHVFEVKGQRIRRTILNPTNYGFSGSSLQDIRGGNAIENASIIRKILDGEKGAHRDVVVFNSALALYVSGQVKTVDEGIFMANKSLDSGNAKKTLERLVNFSRTAHPFRHAIVHPKDSPASLIAEIKLRSPSTGKLGDRVGVKKKVLEYVAGAADCLSVVVDKKKFGGSYELLSYIRSLSTLPILCKDFVTFEALVYKAKSSGADAVLLIVKIVTAEQLVELVKLVFELGMEPVVEVNTMAELDIALKTSTQIISVNARNLDDFSIDMHIAIELLKSIPKTRIALAFSGVSKKRDVEHYVAAGARGVLVGTYLMKSSDPAKVIKELKSV